MAFHVAVKEPLEAEHLGAQATLELGRVGFGTSRGEFLDSGYLGVVRSQWILDAVAPVDDLEWGVRGQSKL